MTMRTTMRDAKRTWCAPLIYRWSEVFKDRVVEVVLKTHVLFNVFCTVPSPPGGLLQSRTLKRAVLLWDSGLLLDIIRHLPSIREVKIHLTHMRRTFKLLSTLTTLSLASLELICNVQVMNIRNHTECCIAWLAT